MLRISDKDSGRTGVASENGSGQWWVFWDDAAIFPQNVSSRYLRFRGAATADDAVCYAPGKPQHGLTRAEARKRGVLPRAVRRSETV